MSTTWEDIGYEDHLWRVEVKKRYDRRHLFEMQLKLDDSETDQAVWEEIELIDEEVSALKEQNEDDEENKDDEENEDGEKSKDWLDEWEKCTPEFVMKKHHRTKTWEDLKIGFSRGDIYMVKCIHTNWEKEFHAENDFRGIPLIKTVGNDEYTTEPYDILRHIAKYEQFSQKEIDYKSAMSRANKLLKVFFTLDSNPITGEINLRSDDNPKVYTSKINFYYLD